MAKVASSASISTTVSTSFCSHALDVALHDLAELVVAKRAQGGLLALLGQAIVHGLARALKGAVHGRHRGLERRPTISCAEKPSTSRRISTARWFGGQQLKRGDERELDALALFVARLRAAGPSSTPM